MIILIIGYPDSGKSELAEQMVTEMSAPGERIYLAAMIPYGEEGSARIGKHRKMREGKGFITIEAPFDVSEAFDRFFECRAGHKADAAVEADRGSTTADPPTEETVCTGGRERGRMTVLLECLSNLVANEMFERQTDPETLTQKLTDDILKLSKTVRNLVIVSNHFKVTEDFDDETRAYAEVMDRVNDRISRIADDVIRI